MALGASIAEVGSARTSAGAMLAVAVKARNIIEVHCMLVHTSEDISQKQLRRWERISILRRRGWADETLQSQRKQLCRHFVDEFFRFKLVKLVKKRSDTTAAISSLISDYIAPHGLSTKCIQTDNRGEFEGES